jgi:hypothetical protein
MVRRLLALPGVEALGLESDLYTPPLRRGVPRHTKKSENALQAIESQKAVE